jgi:hypothetical protein
VAIAKAVELELGNRQGGDRKSSGKILTLDNNKGKRTDDIAAKKAGFGNKETYRQAKKVVETGTPELVKALDENRIKPSVVTSLTLSFYPTWFTYDLI